LGYFAVGLVNAKLGSLESEKSGLHHMRYYFHLRIGPKLSADEIGLELPDLETAYLEAFDAAQTMWGELLSERSDPQIRAFEITDERGQLLLTLPFGEVLDRARKHSPPRALCQSAASNPANNAMASKTRSLPARADRNLPEKTFLFARTDKENA
jgi:hypothetical protein